MNDSTVLPFLLGLVFGITAMLFGNWNASDAPHQDTTSIAEELQEISVLAVTSETIPAYQSISKEMVTVRSMRKSDVPPGALQRYEDLKGGSMTYEDQEGNLRKYKDHWGQMVLKSTAYQGDIITKRKLKWESGYSDYTDIPHGFRIYTISLENSPTDIDAFHPYHLVDVFATSEAQAPLEDEPPRPILERIRIYAVGKPTTEYERKNLSLLLDPHQASILLKAEQKGPLNVVVHEERKASD